MMLRFGIYQSNRSSDQVLVCGYSVLLLSQLRLEPSSGSGPKDRLFGILRSFLLVHQGRKAFPVKGGNKLAGIIGDSNEPYGSIKGLYTLAKIRKVSVY